MAQRVRAIVKNFKVDRGYGFCVGDDGQQYFIHATNVLDGVADSLQVGDVLEITPRHAPKGPVGIDARLIQRADDRNDEWTDETDAPLPH